MQACGKSIPHKVVAHRPGDFPGTYADPSLAARELGWQAKKNLDEMCADTWRRQTNNPSGYTG